MGRCILTKKAKMNDDALSVVYLILVLVLLLPGFVYANKNKEEFLNNFFIWIFIIVIIAIIIKFLN